MLFLIHYNRPQGSLVSIQEFSENDMAGASKAKMELEISLLGGGFGQEVVLLEADSQEDLRKTHRRYFDTLREMGSPSDRSSTDRVTAKPVASLDIRKATVLDVPAIQWLQKKVLPPNHPKDYEKNVGSPSCENLVASIGGEIVGYISVFLTINNPAGPALWHRLAPYVGFVGVVPEHQRKGVCRALLQVVLQGLQTESRHQTIYLECSSGNSDIFEKLGFKRLNNGFVKRTWGVVPRSCVMQFG